MNKILIDDEKVEVRKVTRIEWGVIVSLLLSAGSLLFTAGILYGQVQFNTERIDRIEAQVDNMSARIERVDANVAWLVDTMREERRNGR